MFELQAAAKGLRFRFEPQGTIPEVVRADEQRVRQILINLLGNAIKFTAVGQVTLRVRYARELAWLDVEDTGPGLDAGEIERIFEPFARGASAASAAPGAGLGLTIAKMLTALMGGEMSVSSTPGSGSVFHVKLFLPEVHQTTRHPARVAPARAPPSRGAYAGERRRVLVVDNEEADRELLVTVLTPLGFALRQASSGHDCLDLLAAGYRPHAILMDLAMPGIDGWETLRRVRELAAAGAAPSDVQLAVVSANAFDKGLDNDVGIGAEDFILKPVRHAELLDWLERRLELVWIDLAAPPRAASAMAVAPGVRIFPAASALQALAQAAQLGYYRGLMNTLDEIGQAQPQCEAFVAEVRELARQFQFDAITHILQQAPREPQPN